MASELLKTFEKIETGRKNIINTLKSKDYLVSDNDSFYDIGNTLITIPVSKPNYTVKNGIKYYDNPEDDPEVWSRPTDWLDSLSIYKTFDDIEVETIKTSSTGEKIIKILSPTMFALLDNERDNITFKGGYSVDTRIENSFEIGLIRGPGDVSQSNTIGRIITSDGAVYDLNQDNKEFLHTWDKSKDINGKYRWFVLYKSPTNPDVASQSGSNYTDILELIVSATRYGHGVFGSNISNKLQHLHFIDPFTEEGLKNVDNSYTSAEMYLESSTYDKWVNLKKLTIDNKLVTHLKINTSYPSTSLNTIVAPYYTITSSTFTKSPVKYVYLGSFIGLYGATYNSNSNNSYIQGWGIHLKYLKINEDVFKDYISTRNFNGLCGFCKIQDPNPIIKHIVISGSGNGTSNNADYTGTAVTCKEWNFDSLKQINGRYFMYGVKTEVISLPELEIIPSSTSCFVNTECKYLYMPKLKRIESESFNIPYGVLELELPELEYVAKGLISQSSYTNSTPNSLLSLSLPKLKECSEYLLNRLDTLETLHLPKGFKQSLSLCGLRSLSIESMRELCENLADVTNEEQAYTLKVLKSTYNIYKDCYAIAETKGWVITQLS